MKKFCVSMAVCLCAFLLHATEYHVAKTGNDKNTGSAKAPFLTIQAAANAAAPGDVVFVHEGVYREEIAPPRGGVSDDQRIIFQAVIGDEVIIKGSEQIEGWEKEREGVWVVRISNTLFGDFNPFADEVTGDWFDPKNRKHHTGCVYSEGHWLFEAESKENVYENSESKPSWFAQVGENETVVWAYFGSKNPNETLTEVNVRQTVFYPRKPFVNYISVRGFKMCHAAPKWAPPTAEQMGLIGTHWSRGWIIENNSISYSINVGLSLGKYGDQYDNIGATAEAYLNTIDRARNQMGWSKSNIGSHIVRNNEISYCEQAGIVGSMGASFSTIEGNHIHHIHTQKRFSGFEMAGIKFHAPIDMLIEGNWIHDAYWGIWLDWMTQGTRVTRNLLYQNELDLFMEVNHGPFLIDNNLFLSKLVKHHSQGGAYVHNIFGGIVGACTDERQTPYFKAHSTEKVADHGFSGGDDRFYNNMFDGNDGSSKDPDWWEGMKTHPSWHFGYGLWIYDARPPAPQTSGNIYYDGALPCTKEKAIVVKNSPDIKVEEIENEVYLHITIDPKQLNKGNAIVTTALLGVAEVPQLPFKSPDGNPIKIDTDYFGRKRDLKNPSTGPFELEESGRMSFKVWPLN